MRGWTLVSPFLLSLLLGVTVVLVPMYASAGCCGCKNCWMKYYTNPPCSCPGYNGCPRCLTDDSDPLQFNASSDKGTADTSPISRGLTSTFAKSNVTERVMELMSRGKCFRDRVELSLLGNARDGLKLAPVVFDEKNTLAFLIESEKEK